MARMTALSMNVNDFGLMKPCRAAKNAPAKPPNMAPMANAVSLVFTVSMPERAAGDLVLAQSFPSSPDRQPPHAARDPVGQQRQHKDQIEQKDQPVQGELGNPNVAAKPFGAGVERQPEETWPWDRGDAGIAVGEIDPVDEHEADDLAKRQRDDGEIVAAQPQHRKAEQDAPERGENAGEPAGTARTPTAARTSALSTPP